MVLKAVDLFAGAGGMSLGLEKSGIGVVAAYEWWDKAVSAYNRNFVGHKAYKQNLANEGESIRKISEYSPDIIVGGPPCQDFSSAGSQVEGTRASLTVSFAKIVAGIAPSAFIMENVPNARRSLAYQKAQQIFRSKGYGLTEMVLDSAFLGVPQHRKRLVVIGRLGGGDGDARSAMEFEESILPLSVRQLYPDFPVEYYYRHPRSYKRRAVFSIDEPAPTVRGSNRPKPATYKPHAKDAVCDTCVRALSYQERAMLQTLPRDYDWSANVKTDIEQMIGNAVPVEMARHIGIAVQAFLEDGRDEHESFQEWLRSEKGDTYASARDVVSRLRRLLILTKKSSPGDLADDEIISESRLGALRHGVCSQLIRALELWREYDETHGEVAIT